jgi:hypothetical protein
MVNVDVSLEAFVCVPVHNPWTADVAALSFLQLRVDTVEANNNVESSNGVDRRILVIFIILIV